MRFAVLTFLLMSTVAQAQFGIGLGPGSQCGNRYGPGGGAFNGRDELSNLDGQLQNRNGRLKRLEAQEDLIDDKIATAKKRMGYVLTDSAIDEIVAHRQRKNNRNSYRHQCSTSYRGERSGTDPRLMDGNTEAPAPDSTVSQTAPPAIFCQTNSEGVVINLWDKFADDAGKVSRRICEFCIAGVTFAKDCKVSRSKEQCYTGMTDYYKLMAEKEKLLAEMKKLKREMDDIEDRLVRVTDEITDGTYCAHCSSRRRGYIDGDSGGDSLWQGVGMLAVLGVALAVNSSNTRRPGVPPAYGGPGYPMNPYQARVPGYNGMMGPPGRAMYGGVPGGIGPGAFGCQGANPLAMNNVMPIFPGGPNPFINPYANPMMNPMFNPGAGPWGFPAYGNGYPGFNDPFGLGMPMPGMPMPGMPMAAPYMNPYYSPYNPYMSPGGMMPPPMLPYPGGAMPYMAYNPWGGGAPGTVMGPGYGYPGGVVPAWGIGSPMGNYQSQLYQLNNRVYGGGAGAPVMLPYNGIGGGGGLGFGLGGGAGGIAPSPLSPGMLNPRAPIMLPPSNR